MESGQNHSSTARTPAVNTTYIVITYPEPGSQVQTAQEAQLGLHFRPNLASGSELCISNDNILMASLFHEVLRP